MCLAVPMQVIEVDTYSVRCMARGIEREASLFLFQHEPVNVGDHVLIHMGQVIEKITESEAAASWAAYDEIFAAEAELMAKPPRPGV